MTGKILGKIDFAEYGTVKDYPFLIGLQLGFKFGYGGGVMDGGSNAVNISKECKWEEAEREAAITVSVEKVYQILKDAKVNYVSELINKPVEALEKQIPKKPYDTVRCPLCKIEVELQPIDAEQITYCLHCGQAINWSD